MFYLPAKNATIIVFVNARSPRFLLSTGEDVGDAAAISIAQIGVHSALATQAEDRQVRPRRIRAEDEVAMRYELPAALTWIVRWSGRPWAVISSGSGLLGERTHMRQARPRCLRRCPRVAVIPSRDRPIEHAAARASSSRTSAAYFGGPGCGGSLCTTRVTRRLRSWSTRACGRVTTTRRSRRRPTSTRARKTCSEAKPRSPGFTRSLRAVRNCETSSPMPEIQLLGHLGE